MDHKKIADLVCALAEECVDSPQFVLAAMVPKIISNETANQVWREINA